MRNQNDTSHMPRQELVDSSHPDDQDPLSTRPGADPADRNHSPPATTAALADVTPLLVAPVVDQSFLLCEDRFKTEAQVGWRVRYYLTVTAGLLAVFCLGQVSGYVLGVGLPPSVGLHLAGPLVFAGMLAKSLDSHPNAAQPVPQR